MKKKYKNIILATVLISAFAFISYSGEFSIAGYWPAKGSPRQIETFTTGWEFSLDNFKSKKNVSIPHSIDEGEIGFEASGGANRQQPAWYRRSFIWKKKGERQFLHFEAIMGKSKISLNGKLLTEHFGGYLPIHLEVTGILKEGKNTLEVWCDNSNDPTYPPGKSQNVLDFTYFGGLYRDVYLIETGDAYVADTDKGGVWITSNLNDDGTWKIKTDVTLGGNTENTEVQLFYDGKKVESTFSLKSPSLWSPENPNLHFLRVDVLKNGKLTDRVNVRFGIRDFKMTKEGFVLNGKNYGKKLIGTNRHQDYVFIGNALPNSLHWRDVKKFKDCGMNVFRCAHYPQDPAFMDACDELGMFVIDATPGWQFWNKKHPRFEASVYSDIERMVGRDRSRPSLLFW
jgi:beta-galactosidase